MTAVLANSMPQRKLLIRCKSSISLSPASRKKKILYVFGQEDEPIVLEHHSPVLHLIQQIRDETHRFAVTFHRQRRAKRQIKSALTGIPGVGPRTAQKLLREFGSVINVRRAGLEKVGQVIPRKTAEKLFEQLGGLQSIDNRDDNQTE